ncbi:hypothetical protein ASPCAL05927 [Aspergillus calidoustus]|uniref:Uncharacterized protein n=1 Tax=Aspergillus calidoustus TaxID=454130 RepID=A0A0U5FYR3_ASPCI|nr:hypothetical protein ASPCAL05927 [Aspergillus calidoustus]
MPETQRPRQVHQRPYSAGDHSTYTPLLPAPSEEVIFEMEAIPKCPESIISRAPSQPPPYEEIDTNWLAREDIYTRHTPNNDTSNSRSASAERSKNRQAPDSPLYPCYPDSNAGVWLLLIFMLLVIIGASIGGPLGAAKAKENTEKNDPVPAGKAMQTPSATTTTTTTTATATVTNTVTVTQTAARA